MLRRPIETTGITGKVKYWSLPYRLPDITGQHRSPLHSIGRDAAGDRKYSLER